MKEKTIPFQVTLVPSMIENLKAKAHALYGPRGVSEYVRESLEMRWAADEAGKKSGVRIGKSPTK